MEDQQQEQQEVWTVTAMAEPPHPQSNGIGLLANGNSSKNGDNDESTDTEKQQQQQTFYHKRTAKRVELVKRKARPELQKCGWQSVGYALDSRWLRDVHGPESGSGGGQPEDTIKRVDASQLSYRQFVERYERPGKPVLLQGLTTGWKANAHWNLPLLLRGYRNQKFKCGEDDEGYSVKMKMKYYLNYMSTTQDDSPLYIFDSGFGDRPKTAKLLEDYEVPAMFKDDLFRYATERRRPPYRWFVMGPPRSGTAIHIDPLGTSAWNALVVGHKKWCLIHPSAPKHLVKPLREEAGPHPSEAVTWFSTVYRRVCSTQWPHDKYPVIHAVQGPGEVMFVPSGWWHVVMNLDTTIAVTQNFCSITNLPKVWPKTVRSRPQLAVHWLKALRAQRPELVPLVEAINRSNGIRPLEVEEPCDSSSSSSSSDDSGSESDDGDYGGIVDQQASAAAVKLASSNNGQDHRQILLNGSVLAMDKDNSRDRANGREQMASGGGISQAVADAQRAAIVRFSDQTDEQRQAAETALAQRQNHLQQQQQQQNGAGNAAAGRANGNGGGGRKRKHSLGNRASAALPAAYHQQQKSGRNSSNGNHRC